ncbi:DUF2341 domain-containing protein, partial [Bacteroidota bacterium]
MDEFRFSEIARSGDWINQTYQMVVNQGSYVSFGSEESINAPVVSNVNITPSTAYTVNDLTGYCTATDVNGDDVSYFWEWYKEGSLNDSGTADNNGANYTQGVEVNVANISSSLTSVGDNWTLKCIAYDGLLNSSALNTTREIQIVTPVLESSRISPASPNSTVDLLGYCNASHILGSRVSYYYEWYVDGAFNSSGFVDNGTNNFTAGVEINVANISSSLTSVGDNWNLSCRAWDGSENSSWLSTSAEIQYSLSKSMTLTFNNSASATNLLDFPVLVVLNANRIDYSDIQDQGQDIRFFDEDNTTSLPYEIELWNESGNSYIWVRVPQIDAGSITDFIVMKYDDPLAPDGQNATGVWNDNYKMVHHFQETSGTQYDSTSNNNDGTASVTTQGSADGIAGGANDYEAGSSDNVSIPYDASLELNNYTMEVWTKLESTPTNYGFIGTRFGGDTNFDAKWQATQIHGDIGTGTAWLDTSADYVYTPSIETWYYIVYNVYPDGYDIYLNGNYGTGESFSGTPVLMESGDSMRIGASYPVEPFDGEIDEVRISNGTRSADWINASYFNGIDEFILWPSPIQVQSSRISPTEPDPSDDLLGYCNATQVLGTRVSYYYEWYKDGAFNSSGFVDNGTNDFTEGIEVNVANISSSLTGTGDNWTLKCGAWDGIDNSSWLSTSVEIQYNPTQSMNLYFNNSRSATNLLDFPVLVVLKNYRINYGYTQNNGEDIRFFDEDGTTLLPYEIELWNESGYSYIWVSVPQIDSGSTTDYVVMKYGDSLATDGQDITGVWDNDYRGVWHISETGTGTRFDSSQNSNDAEPTNYDGDEAAAGQIAGADDLDGINDYLNSTNFIGISGNEARTISFWANLDNTNRNGMVGWGDDGDSQHYEAAVRSNNYFLWGWGGGNDWDTGVTANTSVWDYHTITHDGTTSRWYINGAELGSGFTDTRSTTDTDLYIGYEDDVGSISYMEGLIDEIRVSNVSRSADWINASYFNGVDDFIIWPTNLQSSRISPVTPIVSDNLVGYCNATHVLGNRLSYYYEWYNDGGFNSSGFVDNGTNDYAEGIEVNVDNISSSFTSIGDNWTLKCRYWDGTINSSWINTTVMVHSGVPDIQSSRINPSTPETTENLIGYCNATDIKGDRLGYYYQWYNNGDFNSSGFVDNASNNFSEGIEVNVANLSSSLTSNGDIWTLNCRAWDGLENSSWLNTSVLVNPPPEVDSVRIIPTTPYNSSDLIGYCNATDENGDSISYFWEWYKDGSLISSGLADNNSNNYTGGVEVNVANVSNTLTDELEIWTLKCTAYDGILNGTPLNTSKSIQRTAPAINLFITSPLKDTQVKEDKPTEIHGTKFPVEVKADAGKMIRDLFEFNISAVPSGVEIDLAYLQLYVDTAAASSRNYDIHRITSSWAEGTSDGVVNSAIVNGTTWNERWFGQNWGTSGGDYAATATDQIATGTTVDIWLGWDVTEDVKGFNNGSYSNYGHLVKDNLENDDGIKVKFTTKEGLTAEWPRLNITYRDMTAPNITGISDSPDPVVFGNIITINANVTDNLGQGNISRVWVEIQGTDYTMTYVGGSSYEYNYTASNYNLNTYTVYANDSAYLLAPQQSGDFTVLIPPNITSLDYPGDNFVFANGNNIDFNFTVVDDGTIDNCTLYTNSSDSWSPKKTIYGVANNTETNITFDIGNGTFVWNILCFDNSSLSAWFDTNYTVKVDVIPPTTTLVSPPNGTIYPLSYVTLTCNASDNMDLVNLTLYTNLSGSFSANQTVNFTGLDDTFGQVGFNVTNIPDNTTFIWSCLASDISSSVFADSNFTFQIDSTYDEPPNVTLNNPQDGSTTNNTFATFNCSATDDVGLSSLTLYSDRSGSWSIENIVVGGGAGDKFIDMSYKITDIPDESNISWNCKATDTGIQVDWYTSNYTIYVDPSQPNVTLNAPPDGNYSFVNNVSVSCSATDDRDIVNMSLYTDTSGSWQLYDTALLSGSSDTDVSVLFNLTDLTYDSFFYWSCEATDNDTLSSFASSNRSISILAEALPYHAPSDAWGGDWDDLTSPYATGAPDGFLTKDQKLDKAKNIYTFNFSAVPLTGELLQTYLSVAWVVTARNDDVLLLHYSTDGASTWLDLDGTAESTSSFATSYPTTVTNSSYLITGSLSITDLDDIYLRVKGDAVGENDDAKAYIDSIFLKVRHSPPPYYYNIVKNDSVIFQNESVLFNTSWFQRVLLDCYIFYINQTGSFENTGCIDFYGRNDTASVPWTINASPATSVQWYFWANDTFGNSNQTPIQYFTVADPDDNVSPVVNSVTINPTEDISTTVFNITANITDNIGVNNAYAQITFPDGTITNYSMSQISGGDFWMYQFASEIGGPHSVMVYGVDGNDNSNYSSASYFNVTSWVDTDETYYFHGETVRILGRGYNASVPVTLTIFDPSGSVVYGPVNRTSNSQGLVNTTWRISSALTTLLGNYTITLNDTTISWLDAEKDFVVLLQVDNALQLDVIYKTETGVTPEVEGSDSLYTTITGDKQGNDAYVSLLFQDNIQFGYTIDGLRLYVEHIDNNPNSYDTVVEYNDGLWQTASCSPITYSTTSTVDICDLSSDISSIPDENNILLRLNYVNTHNDDNKNLQIAKVNFTAIWVNFTIGDILSITIDEPDNTVGFLNFSGEPSNDNYDAYGGSTSADNPPPAPAITGTEASSAGYTALSVSDNSRWQSTGTTDNYFPYQSFFFKLSQNEVDVVGLTFEYEGYVTKETGFKVDKYRIFAYNYNDDSYDIISSDPIDNKLTQDNVQILSLPAPISEYIDTDGTVNTIVVGDTAIDTGDPSKSRGDVFTDYAHLRVETVTTISGFQNINATAIDGNGVSACDYYFTNSTGFDFADYNMQEMSTFIYNSVSNTSLYDDGYYDITVNCTDTTSEQASTNITVKIVNSPPTINLVSPDNNSNFTTSRNVTFTWNAISDVGSSLLCNVYLNGDLNVSNAVSQDGENTNRTVENLADGVYAWNVSCSVQGGPSNFSETRIVNVDLTPPTINLNTPAQNSYEPNSEVNFTYTPTDTFNISSCEVIVDGTVNKTNTSITNSIANSFTIGGFTEGPHTWSVNCTDVHGFEGNSTTRNFNVDLNDPSITLSNPLPDQTFIGGDVQFNYTAFDSLSTTLTCDIIVNGFVEDNDYSATNGTPAIRNLVLGDGFKEWHVNCTDDSGRSNVSEQRNFTVEGDPTVNLVSPEANAFSNLYNITFVYYPQDNNGIKNCSLYLDGTINQTANHTEITNGANNEFTAILNTEKIYNWTVKCYDNTSRYTKPPVRFLTIDRLEPAISLLAPDNDTSFTLGNIQFNFTVIDNIDTSLTCNLTVTGGASSENINFQAVNNSISMRNETGLPSGDSQWSITCVDDAGNSNTSETRDFFVGGIPDVDLKNPPHNSYRKGNVTLRYTATDSLGISNCTLYINDVENQTNHSITTSGSNYFYLYNLTEQTFNWSVNCTNNASNVGSSEIFVLNIDNTKPSIQLNYPDGDTSQIENVTFNFTANDNNDTSLICNLSIDGVVNQSGFSATAGSPTIRPITGISEGDHTWNVSCIDDAGNANYSSTNSFSINFGPGVNLQYPPDDYVDTDGDIIFNYTVDGSGKSILNCSFLVNGEINQTKNTSEVPYQSGEDNNNFTLTGIGEEILNWTVQCNDNESGTGTDTTRDLHVDFFPPNITLNYPGNNLTISVVNLTLNFTVHDTLDDVLICNITVNDSSYNQYNVSATQGVPTLNTLTNLSAGHYLWNVTCTDGAFTNYSETREFEVTPIPTIELISPDNNSLVGSTSVTFYYTPTSIAVGPPPGFQYCTLIWDGSDNIFNTSIINGEINGITNSSLTEGNHTWAIFCLDQDDFNQTSETRNIYIDLSDPGVTINSPIGDSFNISSVSLNFTATDDQDTNLSCNITVDDTVYNTWALNATPRIYDLSDLNDSIHYWNVTCYDDGGRSDTSGTENFTVQEKPTVSLGNPSNGSRDNVVNVTLYYTPTDNSGTIQNCTLILNGVDNQTNHSVTESQENNFSLINLAHGTYTWDVNCTDSSGNYAVNGTTKTFHVDLVEPSINLTYPGEEQSFDANNIDFNWTPTDFTGSTITCNLSVSDPLGPRNATGIAGTSGTNFNSLLINLSDGLHYWNVTCVDDSGNKNNSETRNFTINQPDVFIDASGISFSNSVPDLFENITVFANVSNIAGSNANNVFVEFWNGLPGVGAYIGNDTKDILASESELFNVYWNITSGVHNVWVVVDPNNAIAEQNETNNNATVNISALRSTINSPENNTLVSSSKVEINFTLQDFTGGSINYSIYVDGGLNGQNGSVSDNVSSLLNVTLVGESAHTIVVEATDVLGRKKNSSALYISYDQTPPTVNFETLNGTFFNDSTPEIFFNITDNLATIINYTLFVGGVEDGNGSVGVDTSTSVNLSALSEGEYNITVEGEDEIGNSQNYSIFIFVDLTEPTISLIYPANGANFSVSTVDLNFSVTDNLDELLYCNLTLDDSVIQENLSVSNGSVSSTVSPLLSEAVHYWNVTCWDGRDSNNIINVNVSETRSFNAFVAPIINLTSPDNGTWINVPSQIFYFNVSDDTGLENCSLLIDGVVNVTKTGSQLVNNGQNNLTANSLNGTHVWGVECYDNGSLKVYSVSSNRTLFVDLESPQPFIETLNGTWFNTGSPLIDFNITDNMDLVLNYT